MIIVEQVFGALFLLLMGMVAYAAFYEVYDGVRRKGVEAFLDSDVLIPAAILVVIYLLVILFGKVG